MFWLLFYDLVSDYIERRPPLRQEHLKFAEAARQRGELLLAGALDDPVDAAVLVFRAADVSVVEDFASSDPYVQNGLVTGWRIRRWNVVIGADSGRGVR